jgi:glycosyltransferase involved in cell wall biosynthesis
MTLISVIIPTYNEEKFISCCLDSILLQDFPKEKMEVFVVDGISSDDTRNIVIDYCKLYSFIHLLDNSEKTVPFAMNLGIKESKGDYIIRLDAHSTFPNNYFSSLVENAYKYNSDNIGGLCITDVKNRTKKALAIKEVLGHRFGVGNSHFRIGISEPMETDTVPFGCFKHEVFDRFGYYDIRLVRNQDIELNKRIVKGGGKVFLIPKIKSTYFARETFTALMKNNYENGLWNVLTVFYTNSFNSLSLRHFIPLLFIISLIIPSLLSVLFTPFIGLSVLSFVLYISILLTISTKLAITKKQSFIFIIYSFIVLHFSYGWGSLVGIYKILINGSK